MARNEEFSYPLIFRILIVLLGNETLYDPTTLENILCVCEVIKYIFEKLKAEQLEQLFKTF